MYYIHILSSHVLAGTPDKDRSGNQCFEKHSFPTRPLKKNDRGKNRKTGKRKNRQTFPDVRNIKQWVGWHWGPGGPGLGNLSQAALGSRGEAEPPPPKEGGARIRVSAGSQSQPVSPLLHITGCTTQGESKASTVRPTVGLDPGKENAKPQRGRSGGERKSQKKQSEENFTPDENRPQKYFKISTFGSSMI